MKPLYCAGCDAPHDVDLGPDDGTCLICGAPLIEDEKEREVVGPSAIAKRMVDTVTDGLAGATIAHGKAPRGQN